MAKILIKKLPDTIDKIKTLLISVYKENEINIKEKEENIKISFYGSIFSSNEQEIFETIKKNFEIIKVEKISRAFIDVHNVEITQEFKENLKTIEESIKPYYIMKKENWWIGLENVPIDSDLNKIIKEIYKIGLCCGLVPKGMVE